MLLIPESIFLWGTVFLVFFIGAFVVYKDPKQYLNKSFFLFTLAVIIWIIAVYFEDNVSNPITRIYLLNLDFSAGAFLVFSLLLLCLDMVQSDLVRRPLARVLIFVIPVILSVLIFSSDFIISGYEFSKFGILVPMYGSFGFLYDVIVAIVALAGLGIVLWKYNDVGSADKTRYAYFMVGLLLSILTALVTNVILGDYIQNSPYYSIYSRFGIYGMLFIVLFPGYAIIRHKLFNIRVIAAETLSFLMLLIMFVQIFFSENMFQIFARALLFLVFFILVVMLIRSIENEVERKEELQMISDSLASANERLRRLDNAKSEFISIASHQLRTPLTAIKGYVSLILEGSYGKVSAEVEDVLEKVYGVQGQLAQLVEDLLNVSRIESGRIQYQYAPVRLEMIITDLVDMFSITAKDKGIALRMHLSKKALPQLTIDAGKIKETISNLIDNAVKYTPQGGEVRIFLEGDEERHVARVTVEDTGVGILPEDKDRLFEKFVRSKETAKMVTSGTGLGLYVGKNFVEAHGGRIWAESEGQGQGARFIVELPYEYSAAGRDEVATFGKSYEGK